MLPLPLIAMTVTLMLVAPTELTVMLLKPPEMLTVAPLAKPVPVMLNVTVEPFVTVSSLVDVKRKPTALH